MEKFNLKWNDFEKNFCKSVRSIRLDQDFHDVTISVGSKHLKAHKLILSSCSSVFKTILKDNPHQHPLLYLRNISYENLQAVLDFMYLGEVNVNQDNLNAFLAVADELQIHGLSGNNESLKEGNKRSGDNSMDSLEQQAKRSRPLLPPAASPRPLLSPAPRTEPPPARQPISKPSDIKQSSTPVIKLEEDESFPDRSTEGVLEDVDHQAAAAVGNEHLPLADEDGFYNAGEDSDMQELVQNDQADAVLGQDHEISLCNDNQTGDEVVESPYNALTQDENGSTLCNLCGHSFVHKRSARRHLRQVHLAEPLQCDICWKILKHDETFRNHMKSHAKKDVDAGLTE